MTDENNTGSPERPVTVRRLPDATIERIAAGEVITRPVRVVVELIDNALDANADRIEISVSETGTEQIRVTDDGTGMSRADAERAVARHTTSKLGPEEDPRGVNTLGFRGEALAAIAEAGHLEMTTNDGGAVGTRIQVTEVTVDVDDTTRARGTTVAVRDLFYDRPARLESLAGPVTEFRQISRAVADYALARPETAFQLTHDGSQTVSTPGTGYTDALLAVYDQAMTRRATELEATQTIADDKTISVGVTGIAVHPSVTRAKRTHLRIAVNGRPVTHEGLQRAVRRGYGSLLPGGREPVAAINVSLPPKAIDPNVHPTKATVDISDATSVTETVETVVNQALTEPDARRVAEVATDLETGLERVEANSLFEEIHPLGSFRELYLLCEADDALLVIDQHAAHERVNFERLRHAVSEQEIPTVRLDPAETVALSPESAAVVEANAAVLAELGFDADTFGRGTVRVRSVPAPFGRVAEIGAFRDAVDTLAAGEDPENTRTELLRELACHQSIKAGDSLSRDQIHTLLDRLDECEQPFTCPHGRPTVLSVNAATLASGFERQSRR